MVDVVYVETNLCLLTFAKTGEGLLVVVQCDQVLDGCDDVCNRKYGVSQRSFKTELTVDLVTTNLGQVVTLVAEEEVVEKCTCSFSSNLLSWTELAVDVAERIFLGEDGVLFQGLQDGVVTSELGCDLFAGHTQRLEEDGDGLLALTVDTNTNSVTLVDFEFEPSTTAWDDACGVDVLVRGLFLLAVEVHTR